MLVVDSGIAIICMIIIIVMFCFVFVVFYVVSVCFIDLFFKFFLEFIKRVCGLRWMSCGGGVALIDVAFITSYEMV